MVLVPLQAAQNALLGHMRPVDRVFEAPDLTQQNKKKTRSRVTLQ